MSDYRKQPAATPKATLRERLFDPCVPKTETERYAADEIERLERELAAVTGREDALVAEIEALRGDVADAEAHNAAMREALEEYTCDEARCEKMKDKSCLRASAGDYCGKAANSALSPDAGAKLLKVVEAAEEFAKFPSIENGHKIVQALAAWRGE